MIYIIESLFSTDANYNNIIEFVITKSGNVNMLLVYNTKYAQAFSVLVSTV